MKSHPKTLKMKPPRGCDTEQYRSPGRGKQARKVLPSGTDVAITDCASLLERGWSLCRISDKERLERFESDRRSKRTETERAAEKESGQTETEKAAEEIAAADRQEAAEEPKKE